jgi:predicted DNA-binding protein
MLLLTNSNINHEIMSPIRLKKILVSCYLEREQLDRLKALSEKTGAPMTHYMREGIALVLEKHEKEAKARKTKA